MALVVEDGGPERSEDNRDLSPLAHFHPWYSLVSSSQQRSRKKASTAIWFGPKKLISTCVTNCVEMRLPTCATCSQVNLGLRLGVVRIYSQVVAVLLVGAVLSGAQCVELCEFLSHRTPAPVEQTHEPEMPCHQKQDSPDTPTPASPDQCAHRELLAEKRTSDNSLDKVPLVVFGLISELVTDTPGFSGSIHTPLQANPPRPNPRALSAVLRV